MSFIDSLTSLLSLIELSESDIRVYAALIELGRSDASRVAKKSGLPRTTTYSVLERLKEKGLIFQEKKSHGTIFIAGGPQAITELAEDQFRKSKKALETAKELEKQLYSAAGRDILASTKIQMFEGKRAVKQMLYEYQGIWRNSSISTNRPWLGFQDDSFLVHYGDWIHHYWLTFGKAIDGNRDIVKIFNNASIHDEKITKKLASITGTRRKLKPLPSKFKFSGTIWIVGEYIIAIKTRTELHYGIQIRDKLLADNIGVIFEYLWDLTE